MRFSASRGLQEKKNRGIRFSTGRGFWEKVREEGRIRRGRILLSWEKLQNQVLKASNPCSSWSYLGPVTAFSIVLFLHHFSLFLVGVWVCFR